MNWRYKRDETEEMDRVQEKVAIVMEGLKEKRSVVLALAGS